MELIYIIYIVSGTLLGSFAGLIPGFGVTATMVSFGVFFVTDNPLHILSFYIAVVCASQYIGSIVAITFGIPGESSSLPAVKEGYPLYRAGKGDIAIGTTAIGSFLGSFIAIILFGLLVPIAMQLLAFWSTAIQVSVFSLAILLTVLVSSNHPASSVLLIVIGSILGLVGIHYAVGLEFFTFNKTYLYNGLPVVPVLMGIFVIPELLKANLSNNTNAQSYKIRPKQNIQIIINKIPIIIVASIIGFFSGLMPALTTKLASNLSYFVQMTWEKIQHRYKGPGNLNCLIAAETANNSASFSLLLPLLFLGIPITASEFVLYDYVMSSPVGFNTDLIYNSLFLLLIVYFVSNVLSLTIAWPFANIFLAMYKIPKNYLIILIIFLIVAPVIYLGYRNDQLFFYICVFCFSGILGVVLRKFDTMPAIFSFLVANYFLESFYRMLVLYIL